jgi:hypothetical protein
MTFSKWSDVNTEARKVLVPDLGIRSWDELTHQEKNTIWLNFNTHKWFIADPITHCAITIFNEHYKTLAICKDLLEHKSQYHAGQYCVSVYPCQNFNQLCCCNLAHKTFQEIIYQSKQDIVYEAISFFICAIVHCLGKSKIQEFEDDFNDISNQFGLNVLVSNNILSLRQNKVITEEIWEPVLNFLNEERWESVNRDLRDSISAYWKNTDESYSTSVTRAISSLQGFMQIIVYGKTGKGDLDDLISKAQSKKLIPDDPFTRAIFKNMLSILMQVRQDMADAHPKKEYANEKTARLTLNLIMIFMQHCLQK